MEAKELLQKATEIADRHKGENIVAIDIKGASSIADYFLLLNGQNKPHVQALSREIDIALHKDGVDYLRIEGQREGEWILMDYGDVIVQIFQPEQRAYYNLDKLWGDMPKVDVSQWIQND